jgi:DNA-binding response OmpR family regulator
MSQDVRLLLVDDDPAILRAYKTTLTRQGLTVETAGDGKEAADKAHAGSSDVILSDISMPQMTGLEFLRSVRAHDLDVPVILMTGEPSLESAVRAVEYGAFHYLVKPVEARELHDTVIRAARLHKMAKLKRDALDLVGTSGTRLGERAALEVRFSCATTLMWMAFQPIVSWRDRHVFGYEAVDDLGAGYAGLTSFTQLEPEIAKLDMSLVRGIDADPRRQSIVGSMKTLCDDLGTLVVTEGVETIAERDTLVALGGDLLQGYLFAKPGRGFQEPPW